MKTDRYVRKRAVTKREGELFQETKDGRVGSRRQKENDPRRTAEYPEKDHQDEVDLEPREKDEEKAKMRGRM